MPPTRRPAAVDDPAGVSVRVIKHTLPEGDALARESRRAGIAAIAKECGRLRENIHILYEPPGAGRVAFGGKLIHGN